MAAASGVCTVKASMMAMVGIAVVLPTGLLVVLDIGLYTVATSSFMRPSPQLILLSSITNTGLG